MVPDSTHPSAASGLQKLGQKVDGLVQAYLAAMEKIRLREGIRIAFEVTRAGNGFITVLTLHASCCNAYPVARLPCAGRRADSNSCWSLQEKELWTLTEDTGEVHSDTGKPIKRPSPECGGYIAGLLGLVALAAAMVEPYIPSASARIAQQLGVPLSQLTLTDELVSKASCPQTILAAGELFTQIICRYCMACLG